MNDSVDDGPSGTARRHLRHGRCRWLVLALLAALACLFATGSLAQNRDTQSVSYPKILHRMVDAGQWQVLKLFPTANDGLTGYIVQRGGYQTIIYSEDGYLFLGPVYGPEGRNLSKRYSRQYKPTIIGQMLDSLDPKNLITQGPASAPTLYAFIDPNCIYCHQLYQRAQSLIASGDLQVHWIMVGVLGQSSIGRAAAILAADDSAAALAKNEASFQLRIEHGGIKPIQPTDRLARVLRHYRQAMFSIGGTGTPTIVFSGPQGRWRSHVGAPSKQWLLAYARQPSRK